jgi:serine/threonine-protein kinase
MFGKYRIIGLLGKGGMGHVYEAYDTSKDRSVALKVLADQFSHDQEFLERFQRESRAAAKLAEPHVIPIHDWGEINGEFYIDMRLVHGADLQQLLERGPLEAHRAVAILSQIASALDAAHAAGLIHRDVKPANIIVTADDFAYLLDFGIAEGKGDSRLTMQGFRVGSLAYMAPERFDDSPAAPAADVYSLACVLHEALTGQTPFPTNTTQQEIAAHLSLPPPRPSEVNPRVSSSFDEVIARGMAKDPDDRYGSAGALGRAAQRALQDNRVSSRGTGPGIDAQVALPRLTDSGREVPPTQALRPHPSSPRLSGPQSHPGERYPAEPSYPTEFTQQPWGPTAPSMYPPQGPPGYGPPAEPPWPAVGPPMGMPPPSKTGMSGLGRTMIALLAVLLVAGIGVGVWFLTRDKSNSTSKANGPTSSQNNSPNGSSGSGGSSGPKPPPPPPPPQPREKPPVLTDPDTSGTVCVLGFPDSSKTEWVSHAGRGSDSTSCTFARNVLDAYLKLGPATPSRREVSAPGSVSCRTREADGAKCDPDNRENFLMQCEASDSPDWITCVGGVEAKVFLY